MVLFKGKNWVPLHCGRPRGKLAEMRHSPYLPHLPLVGKLSEMCHLPHLPRLPLWENYLKCATCPTCLPLGGYPSNCSQNITPYCPIQPLYNPNIGGICGYRSRVLSQGYPTFPFELYKETWGFSWAMLVSGRVSWMIFVS